MGWVVEWRVFLDAKQIANAVFDVVRVWHASDEDAVWLEVCFDFLEDDVGVV